MDQDFGGSRQDEGDLGEATERACVLNIPDFKVSGTSTFLGGTNYAVGGATTEVGAQASGERNRGHNLTVQVSKRYLNPEFNPDGVRNDALHVFVIGTNDLMAMSIGLDQVLSQWADFDKVGVAVAQSTEKQIKELAAAGVTSVLWGNVFNVAQAPSVVTKANAIGGAAAPAYLAALSSAAIAHNKEMDAAIERLRVAHPALKIVKLDLFAQFADVAADPAKYGFTDVTSGANDDKHLFSADGLHPTPKGHRMLAEYAYSVLTKNNVEGRTVRTDR